MTFEELVSRFGDIDHFLEDPDFDPVVFLGDLKDKIDNVKMVLDRMDSTSSSLLESANKLQAKAKAVLANKKRLESYITHVMQTHEESNLVGNSWQLRLRKASVPALQIPSATDNDYSTYYEYIDRVVSYKWKNDEVKRALKEGKLPADFPGELKTSSYVEFKPYVPGFLSTKGRKK